MSSVSSAAEAAALGAWRVLGAGDRVVERSVEILGYEPSLIQIDLAEPDGLVFKGKAANPTHVGILNAVLKLESIARNWVSEAASLAAAKKKAEAKAKYESVRRITEPGSNYYTKATTALANLQ